MNNSEKMSINITVFDNFSASETFGIPPEDYFYFDELLEGSDAVFSEPKYDRPYEISDAYGLCCTKPPTALVTSPHD